MSIVTWDSFRNKIHSELPKCPWYSVIDELRASASEFCMRSKVWRTISPPIYTVPGVCDYTPVLPGVLDHIWDVSVVGQAYPLEKTHTAFVDSSFDGEPQQITGITSAAFSPGIVKVTAVYAGVPDVIVDSVLYIAGDTSNKYNGQVLVYSVSGSNVSWLMPSATVPGAATGSNITGTNSSNMGSPQAYAQLNDSKIRLYPTPDTVKVIRVNCTLKPDRQTSTGVEDFIYESYQEYIVSGAVYRLAAKPGKEWTNNEIASYHKQNFEDGIDKALTKDRQGATPRAKPRMF